MPERWWRKNIFSRVEAYSNLIHGKERPVL